MKSRFNIFVIFVCSLLLISSTALAEFTVATVNINRIMNESKEAKSKKKELDEMSAKAKKKIEDKKLKLQAMEKRLKDGEIKEDSAEAQSFRNEARDFTRFIKDTEADLKNEFLKYNKTLTEKTLNIIAQYSKSNNIDLVLDKSEGNRGAVLYGNQAADISEAIIKELNQ